MIKLKNKIVKYASYNPAYSSLESARSHIPEWFLKTKPFLNEFKNNKINKIPKVSFKVCTAFTESFSLGYVLTLPVDIVIEQTEAGPAISWKKDLNDTIVSVREDDSPNKNLPVPEGFSSIHFTWVTKTVIEIPKGYSMLLTHPLNRYDLPFYTLSGVVDGPYTMPGGNVPVFFKKDFEGIIEKGTPIAQILLFKRENWKKEIDYDIFKQSTINESNTITKIFGWYKKEIWKKKIYE